MLAKAPRLEAKPGKAHEVNRSRATVLASHHRDLPWASSSVPGRGEGPVYVLAPTSQKETT